MDSALASTENPQRPLTTARFRILIADDDAANREAIAQLLQARGFESVTAKDGAEAVQIVQVKLIHLALFDLHMPRLSGLEALQVVRQINSLLPAILMTADATRQVLQEALQAKVHSVIQKPVSANLVLETLDKALAQVYQQPQAAPPRSYPETDIPFV